MPKQLGRHSLLFENQDPAFLLKGLNSKSVKEKPVPVFLHGKPAGLFQGLELFQRIPGTAAFPQMIADLISNTYFRLTYARANGTSATFGTSIVGSQSFRTQDGQLNLIPDVKEAAVKIVPQTQLQIALSGNFSELALVSSTRIYETNIDLLLTKMKLSVCFTALKDIALDPALLGRDAFRLFSISSMYASDTRFDANIIRLKGQNGSQTVTLDPSYKSRGYVYSDQQQGSEVQVLKGSGSVGLPNRPGSPDSPSINARVVDSSMPISELGIQAYLTNSRNVNDDSLSVWIEWLNCPSIIQKDQSISATVEFSAFPAET